jgi:hypothetical protein
MSVNIDKGELNSLMRGIAAKIEAAVTPIAREYQGRPVEDFKPRLDEALRAAGLENVDSTEIAEQISRGEDVRITLG